MRVSECHIPTPLNHSIKLIFLTIFTSSLLAASGISASSITSQLMISPYTTVPVTNGTAINATSQSFNANFNISVVSSSDNISYINISAPTNISFTANNASAGGWVCNSSTSFINCTVSGYPVVNGTTAGFVNVNLTASYSGTYVFLINITSASGAVINKSSNYLYVDTTPPTYTVTINASNNINIPAGGNVLVNAMFSSDIAPLNSVTVNVSVGGTVFPCYANTSISSTAPSLVQTGNCSFSTTTYGGQYGVFVVSNDYASWNNNTAAGSYDAYFTSWNGLPIPGYPTNISIANATLSQKRQKYDIMIPLYGGQQNISLRSNFEATNPNYYDNTTVINSNAVEDLSYNYRFNLNFTTLPNNTLVYFNLTAMGLAPANITSMSVYSPDGTIKNLTLMMPDFANGEFAFYWNGILNNSLGAITTSHPMNGTYNMYTGVIQLAANVTDNRTNYTITIPMSTRPLINITSQIITGWSPTSPPTMGSQINASFYINISAFNQYFSPTNVTATFMFPKNVTFNTSSDAGTSAVISTEVTLRMWNGTDFAVIANTSNYSGPVMNSTLVTNISDTLVIVAPTGSPMAGQNITVVMWGFRYNLSQGRTLGWLYGNNSMLNATAQLTFNFSKTLTGTAAPGTNVIYNATINSGVQGGIIIPDTELTGFNPASSNISSVILNGQTLTEGVQFTRGSIVINGTTLQQGANTFSILYSVPGTTTTTPGGGGGGGSSGASQTGNQSVIFTTLQAGVASVAKYSDKLLDIREINITVNNDANTVKITVSKLDGKPASITLTLSGTIYKYMEINTQNLENSNIVKAKIKFRVNKTWFSANNLDPATTKLNRYTGNAWQALKTTQIDSDSDYYNFEAETSGFSVFAVTASEKTTPSTPTACSRACPAGQSQRAFPDCGCYTTTVEQPAVTSAAENYDWLIYVVVVAAVTVLFVFLVLQRAKLIRLPKAEKIKKSHK